MPPTDLIHHRPLTANVPALEEFWCHEVLYRAVSKGALAMARRTEHHMVVLKGSTAVFDEAPSTRDSIRAKRAELVRSGVLVPRGNVYVLTEDLEFTSPSTAACVMLGRQSNGWVTWYGPDGRTLQDLEDRNPAWSRAQINKRKKRGAKKR